MALRKLHEMPVGSRCAVRIYRNPEFDEYVVKSIVNGKVQGGRDGGYFTSDHDDAHATATVEAQRLRKRPACTAGLFAARRRRKRARR